MGQRLLAGAPPRGLRVLDVLSGEGVGSAVHGASISAETPRLMCGAYRALIEG